MFILVRSHTTFKLWVFHLRKTNFAADKVLTGSPVLSLFIFPVYCLCLSSICDKYRPIALMR